MRKHFIICMITLILIPLSAVCYEVNVHKQIAGNAITSSNFEQYLLNNLGILMNKDRFRADVIYNKTAQEWIVAGSDWEDDTIGVSANFRFMNHFFDPTTRMGLNVGGYPVGDAVSSLVWGKNYVNNLFNWTRTRDGYYAALTTTNLTARVAGFGFVFRSLGQLIHLVHDKAVPAHVRNDAHYPYFNTFLNQRDMYEKYTKDAANGVPGLPSLQYDGYAPVDLVTFNSFDSFWTNNGNGLADFTNSNFVSRNTNIDDRKYALPVGIPELGLYTETVNDPESGQINVVVKYLLGYVTDHYRSATSPAVRLSAYSYFDFEAEKLANQQVFSLNDHVHKEYADFLLPRAVGYSAGLLNYFFRGNIEIALPARGIYSSATATAHGFTSIKLLAKNTTPNNEEMSDPINGSIKLVVRYKLAHEDPFQSLDVATDEEFTYLTASEVNNVQTIPRDSTVELTFDLGQTPLPFWATDVYLQIVYRGKLGNEDGAVAVGFKDISEPTPIDLYNNMDRLCLNGGWYITESQEAIDQAPGGWDIYPHKIEGSHLKISFAEDTAYASPSNYTFSPETIMPGTLYRAYVLSDYGYLFTYSDYTPAVPIRSQDTADHSNAILIGSIAASAIKNQVDYQVTNETECAEVGATAPCDIRYYPLFYTFRGTNIWGPAGFIVDNPKYPVNTSCSWGALN